MACTLFALPPCHLLRRRKHSSCSWGYLLIWDGVLCLLLVGIYTASAALTCLGNQPTQPNRPGSCGHEEADADLFANKWQVDAVKDDACGVCPQHNPFVAMHDALNNTGRQVWYSIHVSKQNSSKHTKDHCYAGPDINGSLVSAMQALLLVQPHSNASA